MFALEKRDIRSSEISEAASREEIGATSRSAMVGHFRSHVPGTDINESTLIASDYLNHFRKLVTLLEAASSRRQDSANDLLSWRPMSYEEHFSKSDFRDKALAIAAYRKASTSFPRCSRRRYRASGEALALLTEISAELNDPDKNSGEMNKTCANSARRLRVLIDEANTIVNGESPRRGVGALFGIR